MKNSRFGKILALVLSLVLIVGGAVAVTILADELTVENATTDTVGLAAVNLNYAEQHQLVYAVRADEDFLKESNGEVCLLLWSYNPEADGEKDTAELYRTAEDRRFSTITVEIDGETYYQFTGGGVALDDLAADTYVLPVVKHVTVEELGDGSKTYSFSYTRGYSQKVGDTYSYAPRATSVTNYAVQKLTELKIDTENEEYIADPAAYLEKMANKETLYYNLITLARSAAAKNGVDVDATATYKLLGIKNADFGYLAEGQRFMQYDAGIGARYIDMNAGTNEVIYARAKIHTDAGYFLYWADQNGNKVSERRFYTIDTSTYDAASSFTVISPVYGVAEDSAYVSFDSSADTMLTTSGAVTKAILTGEDGNSYMNFSKYHKNGQTGETKILIASNPDAADLKVGDVYVVEFDLRINDLLNAVLDEDGNIVNMGSSWWLYTGFSDATTYDDKNTMIDQSQSVSSTTASGKTIYDKPWLFKNDLFVSDILGEWITVRVEFEIIELDGANLKSGEQRFYINGDPIDTTSNVDKNANKIQVANGIQAFWFKFKSMNTNATGQNLNGYDFDVDNITMYSYNNTAN